MKNILMRGLAALALPAMIFAWGCTEPDPEEVIVEIDKEVYLELSDDSYTFGSKQTGTFKIEVDAYGQDWDVDLGEPGQDWIKYDVSGNIVTVTVDVNEAEEAREGELVFTIGCEKGPIQKKATIAQHGTVTEGERIPYFRLMEYVVGGAISPDGSTVAFVTSVLNLKGEYIYPIWVFDTSNGEYRMHDPIEGKINVEVTAVMNDGRMMLTWGGMSSKKSGILDNGIITELKSPEGWTDGAVVTGISDDGRTIVGYAMRKIMVIISETAPVKWVDGEPELLPMPETTPFGDRAPTTGSAKGCSADGSVIYGMLDGLGYAVCWKDGNVSFIGEDLAKKEKGTIKNTGGTEVEVDLVSILTAAKVSGAMSFNGKYVMLTYHKEEVSNYKIAISRIPVIYNLETNQAVMIERETDGVGMAVTDDGLGFYATSYSMLLSSYVAEDPQNITSFPDWVEDKYGIQIGWGQCMMMQLSRNPDIFMGSNNENTILGPRRHYWFVSPNI